MAKVQNTPTDLELKARWEVDRLLEFAAVKNPELSPGLCRRLVVDALRVELARIQWDHTWDDPILPADNGIDHREKPNLYINPAAPEWVEDMFREIFPDANEVSAEEMQSKMKKIVGDAKE
jgi:hypothetical protein